MIETIVDKANRRAAEGKDVASVVLGVTAFEALKRDIYARPKAVPRAELPVVPKMAAVPEYLPPPPDVALMFELAIGKHNVNAYCDEFLGDMQVHWVNAESVPEPVAVVAAEPEPVVEPALEPAPEPDSSPETPDAIADTEPVVAAESVADSEWMDAETEAPAGPVSTEEL